jgi:hypothetical protein
MPVSKKPFTQDLLAKMLARVTAARVFGPQNMERGENQAQVAGLLKTLEARGLVVYVEGHGWVDTSTAIERYSEYVGVGELLATQKMERERTRLKLDGLPRAKQTGDPDWDSYGSPGRADFGVDDDEMPF